MVKVKNSFHDEQFKKDIPKEVKIGGRSGDVSPETKKKLKEEQSGVFVLVSAESKTYLLPRLIYAICMRKKIGETIKKASGRHSNEVKFLNTSDWHVMHFRH
jgi:hypothetical protein